MSKIFLLVVLLPLSLFAEEDRVRSVELVMREIKSPQAQAATKEYDKFLRRLGFEDYSALASKTLESRGMTHTSREVLKLNKDRYEIFNDSRELASRIVGILHTPRSEKEQEKAINRVIEFTARMLALQPLDPPADFPAEVKTATPSKQEDAVTDYIIKVTQQNYRHQLEAVESDLVQALFDGRRLKKVLALGLKSGNLPKDYAPVVNEVVGMGKTLAAILKFVYLDSEMGQTRYLGRALAANLLKYAHDSGDSSVVSKLKTRIKHMGYSLSDFVGNTLTFNEKGIEKTFVIENGSFIMERSIGKEAGEITWGARPAFRNMWNASNKGLLGHFWGPFVPLDEEIKSNLTMTEFIQNKAAESSFSRSGVSHVGIANVLEDPATGIKMTWALDNYPNYGEGGVRITGIKEQFALKGPFIRFAVATYDAKNFYSFVEEQIKTRGYQKVAWVADKEEFDKDGESVQKDEYEKVEIPTLISEKEFYEFHALGKKNPELWKKEVFKKITDYIRFDMVTGKQAIGFAYGFTNFSCRTYCTLAPARAALETVGIDLQKHHDRWNSVLPIMKSLNVESAKDIDTKGRILAPGGFAWQSDLVGFYGEVTYHFESSQDKFNGASRPYYIEASTETTELLRNLKYFTRLVSDFQSMSDGDISSDEIAQAIRGELRKRQKSTTVGRNNRRAGDEPGAGYLPATCNRLLSLIR